MLGSLGAAERRVVFVLEKEGPQAQALRVFPLSRIDVSQVGL
jgi:hypothetical protein